MRPFVLLNAAMSLDGKLSSFERKQVKLSNDLDLKRVNELRAEADAILVGMETVRRDDPKLVVKSSELVARRLRKGLPEQPMKVCVGNPCQLRIDSDFLRVGGGKVIFTPEAAARSCGEKIEVLKELARVYVMGKHRVPLKQALEKLFELGVRKLLVEGGGELNFELLREGLVDEVRVAIAPVLLGGRTSPTLVDGEGFAYPSKVRVELLGVERLGDMVALRYKVLK